jgi:nucleoid DNA-binding protein
LVSFGSPGPYYYYSYSYSNLTHLKLHLASRTMATITKRDLVVKISNNTGMTQQQVFNVVQGLLDTVTGHLADGDEVVLTNFGAFQVRKTKAKVGRNPNQPGTDVIIPPRAVVKFKPGKEMREKVASVLPALTDD